MLLGRINVLKNLLIMVIASDGMVTITVQILIKVKEFFHNIIMINLTSNLSGTTLFYLLSLLNC